MYSKLEASRLRQAFWTAFGQYMAPVPSADGVKGNWMNYKTGVKYIQFRMDADNQEALVTILINPPEERMRKIYYDRFLQLQSLIHTMVQGSWRWQENVYDGNNKTVSKIETSLPGVNVFDHNSWPAIISFLKEKITGLDEFWSNVKGGFESLS